MSDKPSNEQRYWDALKLIASGYDSVETTKRTAVKRYGLDADEVLEMAYDNIQQVAKMTIRGKRRPKQ